MPFGTFDAGSIVAKLVLDKTEYSAALRSVMADNDSFNGAVLRNSQSIKDLGKIAAVAGAAITAAFVGSAVKAANYGAELARVSEKTGIATETLSGLKHMAEVVGIDMDRFGLMLGRLNLHAVAAAEGNKAMDKEFAELGISVTDATGKMKPMDELLGDVAEKFKTMPDGPEKSAAAMKLFGRTGLDMIPVLDQGREGIKKYKEESDRFNLTMSKSAALTGREFKFALRDISEATEGFVLQFGKALLPTLTRLATLVTNVVVKISDWAERHPVLSSAIAHTALAVGALLTVGGAVLLILPLIIKNVVLLGAAFAAASPGLQGVIVGLGKFAGAAAIAVTAGLIINSVIDNWKAKLDEAMGKMQSSADATKKNWGLIRDAFKTMTPEMIDEIKKRIRRGDGRRKIGRRDNGGNR